MDTPAGKPNILYLEGITLKDYVTIEDLFEEQVLEVVEQGEKSGSDPIPFEKIPAVFTSVEEWPFTTNLRCWSCVFTFDGVPCFAPTFVRHESGGRIKIGVEGNFCSFNCAARYIDDTYPPQAFSDKHWRMRNQLCLVYYYFKKAIVQYIKPALRKTELTGFGGNLSEDEFWAHMRELDPKNELRDYFPAVAPERLRPAGPTVWEVCGRPAAVAENTLAARPPAKGIEHAADRPLAQPLEACSSAATEPPAGGKVVGGDEPAKETEISEEDIDALLDELNNL